MNRKRSVLEIPLFQKIYDLYKLLHLYYNKIPKSQRYTLWQKCETAALDLLEILIATSHVSGEKRLASSFSQGNKNHRTKKYVAIEALLQEIMTGGWLRFASR